MQCSKGLMKQQRPRFIKNPDDKDQQKPRFIKNPDDKMDLDNMRAQ